MGGRVSKPSTIAPSLWQVLSDADPKQYNRWQPNLDENLVRIVKVYDGDTLTVLCSMRGELCQFSVRVKGVDCPEMRGRGAREKEAAVAAKEVVEKLCLGRICTLVTHGTDKYGRLIAEVELPDGQGDLTTYLLSHGLARSYAGDARIPFEEHEIATIVQSSQTVLTGQPVGKSQVPPQKATASPVPPQDDYCDSPPLTRHVSSLDASLR
jgi:micrococcal nuclease